jgi:glycosyltransferase involved in cell wall biosynthesis
LLDAFELIIHRDPDTSLTIVGPEWIAPREILVDLCLEKDSITRLAPFYEDNYLVHLKRSLSPGAAKRVTFAGLVAHSDVPTYFGNADIYVNPSLYESFGMSIIEAMAAGLPVVATRVGAVPELISHGHSGLLVEADSPLAIADAVIRLFTDAPLRNSISRVGHDIVSKKFPWQTVCSRLMQMYRDVLATKAA